MQKKKNSRFDSQDKQRFGTKTKRISSLIQRRQDILSTKIFSYEEFKKCQFRRVHEEILKKTNAIQ